MWVDTCKKLVRLIWECDLYAGVYRVYRLPDVSYPHSTGSFLTLWTIRTQQIDKMFKTNRNISFIYLSNRKKANS